MRIAIVLVLITATQVVTAQNTFHGNNARTGVYDGTGPTQLKGLKWSFKTEGPIFSSPAIADGVIYLGSGDGFIYAIDQKNGTQKWKLKTAAPIPSSPAVTNGVVYFTNYSGLYAVLAETGKLKWKFPAEATDKRFEAKGIHGTSPKNQLMPDPFDTFLSSPSVFNGRVYFGSGEGGVYAIDAETGQVVWKFATGDVVHASPAIANGIVYIGSFDSNLYALDAETGQEKWRFKSGEDPVDHNQVGFQSSPAVVDGVVYVGCRDAHVYAIDAMTGRKKWDYYTKKSWVIGTPAVRDGVVYVGTSDSRLFHGIDAKTGRLKFTFNVKAPIFSSAALAGDLAYVGDHSGRLYAINTKTGKSVWEFQTEGSKSDPLKVLNPDGSWNVASFSPFFNDFLDMYVNFYKTMTVGGILSSPVVSDGTVYFGATDGILYAVQ